MLVRLVLGLCAVAVLHVQQLARLILLIIQQVESANAVADLVLILQAVFVSLVPVHCVALVHHVRALAKQMPLMMPLPRIVLVTLVIFLIQFLQNHASRAPVHYVVAVRPAVREDVVIVMPSMIIQ